MEVKCEFNLYNSGDIVDYDCRNDKKESLSITDHGQYIIAVTGVHEVGKGNKDVKLMYISNATVHYFPRGFAQNFPSMTKLVINGCFLKQISSDDLVGLGNLVTLDLDNNSLEALPDDLFKNMKKLRRVCLKSNHLKQLSSETLKPIKKLEHLDLRKNGRFINVWYNNNTQFNTYATYKKMKDILDFIDTLN